jgi:hypothetical protein
VGEGGAVGDEIILDEEGQMDADIQVNDAPAAGLRAGVASQGRVTVRNGATARTSQIRVRSANGQTKSIAGVRLRSTSGKPLALQQFRVRTASGQVKTVAGIRARTSSGKTTVLPVTQVKTRGGKTAAFVSPPKGRSLLVTRKANGSK